MTWVRVEGVSTKHLPRVGLPAAYNKRWVDADEEAG